MSRVRPGGDIPLLRGTWGPDRRFTFRGFLRWINTVVCREHSLSSTIEVSPELPPTESGNSEQASLAMSSIREENISSARADDKITAPIGAVDDDHENLKVEEETARVVDHAAERALCRKFDIRLMPVLAIMCMLSSSFQALVSCR